MDAIAAGTPPGRNLEDPFDPLDIPAKPTCVGNCPTDASRVHRELCRRCFYYELIARGVSDARSPQMRYDVSPQRYALVFALRVKYTLSTFVLSSLKVQCFHSGEATQKAAILLLKNIHKRCPTC